MRVGLITGTGTYTLPGAERAERVDTRYGVVEVGRGSAAEGFEVLHVSRHGEGHARLSNQVAHRANIAALSRLGADCAVGVTVCGAVDPAVALGSLICFDDLHFPQNRLADGSLATFHEQVGAAGRGHWIFESPFSDGVRGALLAACAEAGVPARDGGCYGHVDGPRFNTRAEIRSLALAGVTAVSQTAGPETALAGEAQLPYALLGYATDYANGVMPQPTPVEELLRLIAASNDVFASVLERLPAALAAAAERPNAPGVIYRFD